MKLKEIQGIFSIFADETRLRILSLLGDGELCVCDIMRVLKEPQSKISRHLATLREAGFVQGRRKGLWMHYSLKHAQSPLFKAVYQELQKNRSGLEELKKDQGELKRNRNFLVACCP